MKAYVGTFVISLMVFMLFGPIQANGISKSQDTMFQDEGIQLTVVDQDQSEISKGLIHYLKAEDQVTILHKANKKALENLNDDILFEIFRLQKSRVFSENLSQKMPVLSRMRESLVNSL